MQRFSADACHRINTQIGERIADLLQMLNRSSFEGGSSSLHFFLSAAILMQINANIDKGKRRIELLNCHWQSNNVLAGSAKKDADESQVE